MQYALPTMPANYFAFKSRLQYFFAYMPQPFSLLVSILIHVEI